MAGEKQNEGPNFLMGLGMQLGKLEANQDALLSRIENIEAMMGGGQQLAPQPPEQHHQAQQLATQQPAAKPSTPLDTFVNFTGETGKLLQGINELKKLSVEFAPLLASLKAQQTAPAATQPAQPAAPTAPAAAPVTSVFQPTTGHA